MKIKILHVVSSTFTGSGVMNFIMNYYRNIDNKKFQFDFLSFKKSIDNFDDEIKALGGNIFYISKPSLSISFYKEAKNFFAEHESDYSIIHCHPIYSFLYVGIFIKNKKIKLIQHSHTNRLSDNKISIIRNKIILLLAPFFVDKYCACSLEALSLFSRRDLKKKGYKIFNNAIDYNKYRFNQEKRSKIRKRYNIEENVYVYGHVGRFSPEKNHKIIIDVFEELLKTSKQQMLMLVGDGPKKEEIINYVNLKGLSKKVIFTGNVANVQDHYFAMDYFIFPSSFEGFGMALLEAQISGLQCVTSFNVPESVIITENVKRTKIEVRNIYKTIQKEILNKNDREKAFKKIKCRDYDINSQSKMIEDFYLDVCKE